MKRISLLLSASAILFTTTAVAQKGKGSEASNAQPAAGTQGTNTTLFDAQVAAYKTAMKYYDLQSAASAVYTALALKPERVDLVDTLAYIYFAGEKYPQAFLVGEDLLKKDANRNDIREIVAVSKQSLGMVKESLADYEKLFGATKDLQFLYQMATLQYQLKRFGECINSLDQIIANPESAKLEVALRNQDGSGQKVPMKAAAYNVKGICAMEVNQKDAAKENFSKALELYPDFQLAQNNVKFLSQPADPKATTTPLQPKQQAPAPKK
jgi:tetratricopeptide (TPR) repeat protein